jgi:rhodanese-related sulfurtransferase
MEHGKRFLKLVREAKTRVREVSVAEVRKRIERGERFHLVDVREDREWRAGRLPGALHLGRGVLERDIERAIPDASADIVLYCGGGYRSALAADNLQKMGYRRVASMDGGYKGWVAAGHAVEAAPQGDGA